MVHEVRQRWGQLRQVSGSERWIRVQTLFLLPAIAVGLRLPGLRRCYSLLSWSSGKGPSAPAKSGEPSAWERARNVSRLVAAAAWFGPYGATCRPRCRVLRWLRRRRKIPATLRIGVQKQADTSRAHAWGQLADQVLNDRPNAAPIFAPFAAVEGSGSR